MNPISSPNFTCLSSFLLLAILIATNFRTAEAQKEAFSVSMSLSCNIEFSDLDEKLKIVKDCAEKQKFEAKLDGTFESYAVLMKDLSAKGFDDGCFTKCWYEGFGLTEKDGKVKPDMIDAFYKNSNITESLLKETKPLFEDCVKMGEEKVKDAKEIPCAMYAMVEFCFFEKVMENKKKVEELCGQ